MRRSGSSPVAPSAVILYDAECDFCRWSIGKLLSWDRHDRLRPVALQDLEADVLLEGMAQERKVASWHLVVPDGCIYSRGAVVPPLMRVLPGGRAFAALAARFPRATEWAYGWVARNRGRLSRYTRGSH
jgi:predicted DCC family thiol-disulfide oxidoreductase YuxK